MLQEDLAIFCVRDKRVVDKLLFLDLFMIDARVFKLQNFLLKLVIAILAVVIKHFVE